MKKRNGEYLLLLRRRLELTQEEAAAKAGISPQTLANLEKGNGNPTHRTLVKLAKAYNVTVVNLMTGGLGGNGLK